MPRDRTSADIAAASAALTLAELQAAGVLARPLTRRQASRLARLLRARFRGCLRAYHDRQRWPALESPTRS